MVWNIIETEFMKYSRDFGWHFFSLTLNKNKFSNILKEWFKMERNH